MIYIAGVLLPVLIQALIVFVIIEANTGNGSWVGLAAWLLALVCIPTTIVLNIIHIRAHPGDILGPVLRCYLTAMSLPIMVLLLFIVSALLS